MSYSYQGPTENTAKAKANRVKVSPKKTMETCNAVKGKTVEKALEYLKRVEEKKDSIPYKKHNKKVAHRKQGQSGGYPMKSIEKVREVIESAAKNAEYQGLNTNNLKIVHAAAYKSGKVPTRPKKLNRKSISYTTIEIVIKGE